MDNTLTTTKYPVITRSNEIFEKADKIMHPVTQTLAKGPTQFINGVAPKYLERGKGSHVWDVDGNEYIDLNMGIGPISLGYCYPAVDDAIKAQLEKGITFSLMHRLEYEVSDLIHRVIPNAESVRISKSGADVCSAAIRIARAYTKKDKVLCCGYHGWHDWYIGTTTRDYGIPKATSALTEKFPYNDLEAVEGLLKGGDVACVILEPFVFEAPKEGYLEGLQELCKKHGALLIFDEMWSGFRVAVGGAQEYFGITPDLAVYSKAVANGMPIAFLTGRSDVMELFENDVFFFTTFGGEALSMAATIATINELIDKRVPEYLAEKGAVLKESYNSIAADLHMTDYTSCSGFNCRSIMTFSDSHGDPLLMKSLVQQEMIARGVLWGGFHNMCYSHSDADIEHIINAYAAVLPILKKHCDEGTLAESLKGEPVQAVFRKTKF